MNSKGSGQNRVSKFPSWLAVMFLLGLLLIAAALCPFLLDLMRQKQFPWLFATTFVVIFGGGVGADIWQLHRILKYIRDKHPDASKRLGMINVRLAGLRRNTTNSFGLQDPVLDEMFNFKRRFDKVAAVLLFMVILFAILLLR